MFKETLKNLRISKNLTQTDIAKELKISRPTYTRYETGEREPNFETLNKLADFFNVSTDFLLGKTDEKDIKKEESLIIPDDLKDVKVAFHHGEDGLTQDEVDKIAEYVQFLKSQRKDK